MPQFILHCQNELGHPAKFLYNTDDSSLTHEDGSQIVEVLPDSSFQAALVTSRSAPAGKSRDIRVLKISLGMSCNYECGYCNQRLNPEEVEQTNSKDIAPFVAQLKTWMNPKEEFRIEFWGGEPFVYWKTLKPLAEQLRSAFPNAVFLVVTNGSLLDMQRVEWLDDLGFTVAISHDGENFEARGKDPLDDPKTAMAIHELYRRLHPKGRISLNAMMHYDNQSRALVNKFMVDRFGEDVRIGEGAFIDPYEAGGIAASLTDESSRIAYRRQAFQEIRSGHARNFTLVYEKITSFIETLKQAKPSSAVGQKCGMDRPDSIAIDLHGNVLTCQNTAASATAPNGESHKIGHVDQFEDIKLTTSTHWSKRPECPRCPVLHLCKGSCMFLEGDLWEAGCDNAYADNIVFLAAAIEAITGYIIVRIEGEMREDRKDIWGMSVNTEIKKKGKVIPITSI